MNKRSPLLSKESLAKGMKYITFFVYYILPIIVLATLIGAIANENNIGFQRQEGRGNIGWQLLAITLFIKPITFLGKKYLNTELITLEQFIQTFINLPKAIKNNEKKFDTNMLKNTILPFITNSIYSASHFLMTYRRQLGIAAFWCILSHGFLWEIFRIRQGFSFFYNLGQEGALSGTIAFLAIAIGALTSNNYAIKKLQKRRKEVQMVAYLGFFFGAIHTGNSFWLIVYFTLKFFERRDTGTLTIRQKQAETLRLTIKNNKKLNEYRNIGKKRAITQRNKIRNNKRIADKIDKICKN